MVSILPPSARTGHPFSRKGGEEDRSYAAWVYPGQGKIKLWRHSVWHIDTPPTTMLAEASVSISTGVFHTLAVTFDGSQISVDFNGTTVLQVSDTTHTTSAGTLASLTVGGNPVAFTTETIKGISYAVFPASTGSWVATYAP